MPSTTGRAGVEQLSPNTYRVGIQVRVTDPLTGRSRRQWVRETHTYPANLTRDQQLDLADADREIIRRRCQHTDDAVDLASPPKPDELTVAQLIRLWSDINLSVQSADYRKTAESLIRLHILPQLGNKCAAALTKLEIHAWVAQLTRTPQRNNSTKTLGKRTVRHCYITLSSIYNWAIANDILHATPFDRMSAPKARKYKPMVLDDDQAVDLLRCLSKEPSMEFRAAVLLALTAGLRLSEVDALTWHDISWHKGIIDITKAVHQTPETGRTVDDPKTDQSVRVIAASAEMLALLDETHKEQAERAARLGKRWHGQDLIVCAWDGSPLNKDTPSRQWRHFADRHGYQGVTFHNLRTTHATILMANNMDAVAVASRLGHTDATTTLRYYAMVVSRRDRDSAAVMGRLIARASSIGSTCLPQIISIKVTSKPPCTTACIRYKPSNIKR